MRYGSLIPICDTQRPTREEMAALMADLCAAVESDPTLERRWMLMMSRYIFYVVGDWKEKVDESYQTTADKVESLQDYMNGIHREFIDRQRNVEQSARLCLSVANQFFPKKQNVNSADVGSASAPERSVIES